MTKTTLENKTMKVLVIIIALFFSTVIQAQITSQEKNEVETKAPALEVKLSASKSTFCVGEEISWRYELTNLTEQTIKFYKHQLSDNWSFEPYRVEDEKTKSNKTNINIACGSVDSEIEKPIVLEPKITQIETVTFSTKSKIVRESGKYIYKVVVQGVESNEVVFEVCDCEQVKTEKQK